MGVVYNILCLCLALNLHSGSCLSEFHGILTDDELQSYERKAQIKEYDIILPRLHGPAQVSKRSVDSTNHNEAHKVTFTAFEEDHNVVLEKNLWLLRPGLEVEYLQPDGTIRKEPVQTRHCHFFATSISHNGSTGALSTCTGLRGVLSVENEMLYIEPLKEDHTRRMKRRSEDAARPHIIYKRISQDDVPCPAALVLGANGGSDDTAAPANETVYTGPYLGAKYMEIFYVVDFLVYEEFTTETESYATSIMNVMSRRFADPTLDISLRLSVVRLLISLTPNIRATTPSGITVEVVPEASAGATLPIFCAWQSSLSVNDDTDPNDWDLAILFTGYDLIDSDGSTGSVGIAYTGTICNKSYKCGIVENIGLSAGHVMAHDAGHSIGLQHDGDYGCTEGVNIMSATLTTGSGSFEWSTCSSENMKTHIRSRTCMDDNPTSNLSTFLDLPGQIYSADAQCKMNHRNSGASSCNSETKLVGVFYF